MSQGIVEILLFRSSGNYMYCFVDNLFTNTTTNFYQKLITFCKKY